MELQDLFTFEGSVTLLKAVEKIDRPANFLSEMFFPKKQALETDFAAIEYRKVNRNIAPYVVSGARGVNIARGTTKVKTFFAPNFAASRVIGIEDLRRRQFGEIPNIFNAVKPEERLAKLQAQDLLELTELIENRRGVMAAEILQTGKLNLRSYADDGRLVSEETIDFDCSANIVSPTVHWDNAAAKIYSDLLSASETIQEATGTIPTVAICGRNIENYLIQNDEIKTWLMVPNRENMTMINLQPHFTGVQARFIGRITSLNLDLYSYSQTYFDDEGNKKYFVGEDNVIMGTRNGSTCYFPITLMQNGQPYTVSANVVPQYTYNDEARTRRLTVYSRFVQVPETFGDWITIKARG